MKGIEKPLLIGIFILIVLLAIVGIPIINYIFNFGETTAPEQAFGTACIIWKTKYCKEDAMSDIFTSYAKGDSYCCDSKSCDTSCNSKTTTTNCPSGKYEMKCISLKELCTELEEGSWEKCKIRCYGCP